MLFRFGVSGPQEVELGHCRQQDLDFARYLGRTSQSRLVNPFD